jgi:hypothetical protein
LDWSALIFLVCGFMNRLHLVLSFPFKYCCRFWDELK